MSCATCNKGDGTPRGCRNNGHCASGGCGKLDVFDWLSGVALPAGQPTFPAVEVRFKGTRKSYFRNSLKLPLQTGDIVVVEASPGEDVGMVTLTGELVRMQMTRKGLSTDTFELRQALRKATQEDLDRWHAARGREQEALEMARKMARASALEMKVSDLEFQGDGTKVIIHYTADHRVDFRSLVRRYADQFKVRIEMKQIGVRQEAGRLGGIGSCGRELCCSTWLTDLRTVSTSSARYQQLALNPDKLAGQCGKLKCCLNYELDMYLDALKDMPSQNKKLKTKLGTAAHMKTDIFKRKMWYMIKTERGPVIEGLPEERVREIIEMNARGEEPEVLLLHKEKPKRDLGYDKVDAQDALTRFDDLMKKKKRKRSGKKRKPRPSGNKPGSGGPKSAQQGPPSGGGTKRRRKKRRRPGKEGNKGSAPVS